MALFKRRFRCRQCGRVFTEPDPACGRGRRTTGRLRETVAKRAREATVRAVAREEGVSEGLVERSWLEWHSVVAPPSRPHVFLGLGPRFPTEGLATEIHLADHTVVPMLGQAPAGATLPTVHDKAVVPTVGGFTPTGTVDFTFFTNGTCSGPGTPSGTGIVLDGSGVAHPSTSQGALAAGSYSFRAHYSGDLNYLPGDSDCEPFTVTTITINKLANGGNDTFCYTVTGPSPSAPCITTSGSPGTGTTGAFVVLAGSYTVGEDTPLPSGWVFVGLNCAGSTATSAPTTSALFSVPAGTNKNCDFENTKEGKTRTQGFWATHTAFANASWAAVVAVGDNTLCSKTITAVAAPVTNSLMGGFWANIAKTTTGAQRSSLDKARMALLQQLLAALLNRDALGTPDGGLIATAKTAYCGAIISDITASTSAVGAFNQSGDSIPLGFPVPAATPRTSQFQADKAFWNTTT